MANLKNRINRLTKLRGPVEQKGINSLDLFLVGALAGLYSKKLIIQNDIQSVSKSFNPESLDSNQIRDSAREEQSDIEHSESLKSIFKSDRLSNSVSDYVSRLEKQDYSDYSNGFYMGQLDNIAKAFAVPLNAATLTEFAEQSIASIKKDSDLRKSLVKQEAVTEERTIKNAKQESEPEKAEDIENADQFGYEIKLLAIAKRKLDYIELRVHPTLIPKKSIISNVNGAMNALLIVGDIVGQTLYYGAGAGGKWSSEEGCIQRYCRGRGNGS